MTAYNEPGAKGSDRAISVGVMCASQSGHWAANVGEGLIGHRHDEIEVGHRVRIAAAERSRQPHRAHPLVGCEDLDGLIEQRVVAGLEHLQDVGPRDHVASDAIEGGLHELGRGSSRIVDRVEDGDRHERRALARVERVIDVVLDECRLSVTDPVDRSDRGGLLLSLDDRVERVLVGLSGAFGG